MSYGIHGAYFVTFPRQVSITSLEIDGEAWMVDDPPHWWSICDTAARLSGHVLVGGLGLGLILHAMARNENVHSAVVIEREPDVIGLMTPNLPPDLPLEIVQSDFTDYVDSGKRFDSAFVDLWVLHNWDESDRTFAAEVLPLAHRVKEKTGAPMYTLGFIGSEPLP